MADLLKIFWSERAVRDLENIIHYLEKNWSEKEIKTFLDKLNKAISLISVRPKLFRLTNYKKNLRKCVLTKQTTIYYQEINSQIFIVSLFDNRQNPSKIT